jgi:MFS family permease
VRKAPPADPPPAASSPSPRPPLSASSQPSGPPDSLHRPDLPDPRPLGPAVVGEPDAHPARWRMLALLAAAELLGMSLWFAASAVAPQLSVRWGLSASQAAWLTTVVQLGFVAGTACAALLNLADIVASRLLFAVAAALGALANGALLLVPRWRASISRATHAHPESRIYLPRLTFVPCWRATTSSLINMTSRIRRTAQ